jgi:hypothetical protein
MAVGCRKEPRGPGAIRRTRGGLITLYKPDKRRMLHCSAFAAPKSGLTLAGGLWTFKRIAAKSGAGLAARTAS